MYPAPQCPIHTQVYLSTALKAIRDGIWTRQCILIVSYCAPTASSEVLACSSRPSMAQSHRVFFSSFCMLSRCCQVSANMTDYSPPGRFWRRSWGNYCERVWFLDGQCLSYMNSHQVQQSGWEVIYSSFVLHWIAMVLDREQRGWLQISYIHDMNSNSQNLHPTTLKGRWRYGE